MFDAFQYLELSRQMTSEAAYYWLELCRQIYSVYRINSNCVNKWFRAIYMNWTCRGNCFRDRPLFGIVRTTSFVSNLPNCGIVKTIEFKIALLLFESWQLLVELYFICSVPNSTTIISMHASSASTTCSGTPLYTQSFPRSFIVPYYEQYQFNGEYLSIVIKQLLL